ncbi:bifunctional DNA-formamidopyrimidine glycosylase/DNA-(apurinic or apyrimidinic site) lyase [Azonexus sp.]|jgi:formamidopyrimidine-DNA glycosylase|uniref:bifunctional DNA-formamidopyrimidine glycosylase/DNA-(apurinic or apyrimidinic site) lyase n=1 Tax=Azonexus sp. TaxID=1872668 RepID=UPI00283A420B|nr:bifunctional DNA-formamidopyrimidine glycosylase/DNA-(apurinic or apyrimidinic site) lyase [Azonexus sp.]MDR1994701.1 bifunctional DNA-formamidopyrimidine glycosylase/DNA-(apurinic or apyrimidinic site) lyase [Azonexus sp.]
MPELPEVEVCRRGLLSELAGRRIEAVRIRTPKLRYPIPPELAELLPGCVVQAIRRRGKYLLLDCARPGVEGSLIVHLGMSGHLHFVPFGQAPEKHDHFELVLATQVLRLADPRRFGLVLWQPGPPAASAAHPLLAVLGVEPLAAAFDGAWLHAACARRAGPIKPVLMDSHLLVGVGNIYASESLFRAGISPLRAANRISRARYELLAAAIRETLSDAIAAGGSSIRDYVHSDGSAGWFQIQAAVYERAGAPCRRCDGHIRQLRQAGRSTYYCPRCQH